MKKGVIISLGHKARSGKDTVANYLCKNYGFKRIGFADALKRGCMEFFGWTEEHVYGSLKEVNDPYWEFSPRFALQKVGTECMRNQFDQEIWIKAVGKRVLAEPNVNWVIADCRFPNEAKAVRSWGGKVVKIDRPTAGASEGIAGHASEFAMDNYDGWYSTLSNNGTLIDLYQEVDEFWKKLGRDDDL